MISERAATALGTVATVCWCVQLIPQIIYNWKRKDCTGLPPIMMFLWVISGIPFAIYFCVSRGNVILQIQPHLFMFFCSISFIQSCYYPPTQLKKWKIVAIIGFIIASDVGMEVGFILWLRPLYDRGIKWPDLIFGILASVLLAIGLLPPFFELAKRNGRVVGINFGFLFIDSLGAWLSIVSVVLGNMDVMGIILYCVVAGMELGIFLSHFIWCCRFKWFGNDEITNSNDHNMEEVCTINEKDDNQDGVRSFKGNSNMDGISIKSMTREFSHYDDRYSVHDDEFETGSFIEMNNNYSSVHAVHGIILQKEERSIETI